MPAALDASDGLAILKTLRPKIARFCREYIIDFNGKRAATCAGYPARTSHIRASQILATDKVQRVIQALVKKQADKLDLTAERVMAEVARIAFSDARELFDGDGKMKQPKDWSASAAAAIASYDSKKKTVRFWSKTEALTLAARITKIIGSDAPSIQLQGQYMIMVPATSSPDEWLAMAAQQTQQKVVTMIPSSNGDRPIHRNGDGK